MLSYFQDKTRFFECLGLVSQYEKYYCLILKFLIRLSYVDV